MKLSMVCLSDTRKNSKRSSINWLLKGMMVANVELNCLHKDFQSFHVILFLNIFIKISSTCILIENPLIFISRETISKSR